MYCVMIQDSPIGSGYSSTGVLYSTASEAETVAKEKRVRYRDEFNARRQIFVMKAISECVDVVPPQLPVATLKAM